MPIKVPKDREVPFGAITPAPIKQQELFITSNWRIVRPVIDHEKCTRCFTCYIACPDSCWSFNEKEEQMEWNWKFCKGCRICVEFCPTGVLAFIPSQEHPHVLHPEKCTACHWCDTHCPDLAIVVQAIN